MEVGGISENVAPVAKVSRPPPSVQLSTGGLAC